jgi:hypothetical protein
MVVRPHDRVNPPGDTPATATDPRPATARRWLGHLGQFEFGLDVLIEGLEASCGAADR